MGGAVSEQAILPIGDIANNYDPNPMIRKHGRGPAGAVCGTCSHIVSTCPTGNKRYWKCERRGITHGQGTDHRLRWAACRLYEVAP